MDDLKFCKECQSEGKKSRIQPGSTLKTLHGFKPFYDEDGKLHAHDPNRETQEFTCSNNHKWTEKRYPKCSCGWSAEPVATPETTV